MTQISARPLNRREAIAAMGAVALAACFSDRGTDPPVEEGVEVEMTDFEFQPATLNIQVGERVIWRNTGQVAHTATCDPDEANDPANVQLPEGADPWDSGGVAVGSTFSREFDVPGEYRYFCIPHESQGMVGTIIVS